MLQQLNYLDYLDIYKDHIRMFHVKDAEFNPTGRQGIYGGYQSWVDRAGRFRSLGDGQVDFKSIFSKLTQHGYQGWAALEWECCLKDQEAGARGRGLHQATHHSGHGQGVRRFRRRRHQPGRSTRCWASPERTGTQTMTNFHQDIPPPARSSPIAT